MMWGALRCPRPGAEINHSCPEQGAGGRGARKRPVSEGPRNQEPECGPAWPVMERSSLWGTEHSSKEAVLGDGHRRALWRNCGSQPPKYLLALAAQRWRPCGRSSWARGQTLQGRRGRDRGQRKMSRNRSQASFHN